jgi:hypothetical protein
MTVQMQPERDLQQQPPPATGRAPRRVIWALIAVIALLGAALVVFIARDDNTATTGTTAPSTAPSTSPSTAPSTSPSTSPSVTVPTDTSTAVWPFATSTTRYATPEEAARGFAVDMLGFVDPVVSPFMQGDTRSGEVEIQPNATGPVTTVFVRQLGRLGQDDSWWILGAVTNDIRLDQPPSLTDITSPVHLSGTSTAFEAQVNVAIYADGQLTPLASTFVMGGSNGEFGPFTADVPFTTPHASAGSIVMFTRSMENGQTWEACAIRVHFPS